MPDDKVEVRDINLRQVLPWTEIFRSFQIALDPRKLLLAAAGILVMSFGWWVLALIFQPSDKGPSPSDYPLENYGNNPVAKDAAFQRGFQKWDTLRKATEYYKEWPWNVDRGRNPLRLAITDTGSADPARVVTGPLDELGVTSGLGHHAGAVAERVGVAAREPRAPKTLGIFSGEFWSSQVPTLLEPLVKFLTPITNMVHPNGSVSLFTFSLLGMLWTLGTWAIFGGAITRIAAVQIARRERIGMVEALKFAWSKFISFFSAPLFPAMGVAVIALIMIIIAGLVLLIPWVGDFLAGVAIPLALIGGIIMALLLVGYLSWPLMYATISTEGSDSFDALSRSYAYLYQRPWHYFWYAFLAVIYGVLVTLVVVFVVSLFVYMARWALGLIPWLGWRQTGDPVASLFVYAPISYEWRQLLVGSPQEEQALLSKMNGAQYAAAGLTSFWLHLLFLMMLGFAYSYFWSASTFVYFLLRKKVDDTELDEVYLEEQEEEAYPMPQQPAPTATGSPSPSTLPMVESSRPAGSTEPPPTEAPKPEPNPAPPRSEDGNPPP